MKRRSFLSLGAMTAAATLRPRVASATAKDIKLPSQDMVHVGGSRRIDIGGGHWVWTKKVGSGSAKVLLLHGGPGADHRYFEGFEDFFHSMELSSTTTTSLTQPIQRRPPTPVFGRSNGTRMR